MQPQVGAGAQLASWGCSLTDFAKPEVDIAAVSQNWIWLGWLVDEEKEAEKAHPFLTVLGLDGLLPALTPGWRLIPKSKT